MFKYFNIRNKDETTLTEQESWTVSWTSRYGEFYDDINTEFKVFPNKHDAVEFKDALKYAHKLLKNTHDTEVKLYQN